MTRSLRIAPRLDRRRFLQTAAAASLAATTAPRLFGAEPAEPWKMRLSTSSIEFMQLPIDQACKEIQKLGFEAVDIWSAHEGCPHLDDILQNRGADGLRAILDETQLKLFAFSVYAGGFARYAELLGKMGGGVAIQGSAGPCPPEELTARMAEFIEQIKPLAELAEKHNCYLAIENHGSSLLDSLDSMKAFVAANQSPRVGIALAPYHVQIRSESVEEAIRICGPQLFFFYAWQHAAGIEQLPGVGPTDCTGWIAALAEVGYRGYVNAFMHGHPPVEEMSAALARSKAYLEECSAKVSRG